MIPENYLICLQLETGRLFFSEKEEITIGAKADCCELVLSEDACVSGLHAVIRLRGEDWYLEDRHSTNGTFLNGKKLSCEEEYPLQVGDRIQLARTTLTVRALRTLQDLPGYQIPRAEAEAPMPPAPSMQPSSSMAPSMPSAAPSMAQSQASSGRYASMQPKPAKKPGLFSGLFGRKKVAEPAAPESLIIPTVPEMSGPIDDVQFRGTAPQKLIPGEYFPVKIMMYREDDYQRADRESAMVADRTRSASSSVFQAARDQLFRITLQSPDIPVDCKTQQLRWNGKFASADFEVFLPEGYDRKQLRLQGRVYTGDAVLTDLKLILQVDAAAVQQPVCEKVRLRSAFISYASADRAKVVARIQGIQLACPDMDLFFDVESLRRGEHWEGRLYQEIASRDLFYLFWSSNAAASEWVRKELQFAVSRKTLDYIEPIPLESPEVCAPPDSLATKHFNDWTLRYLSNS